MQNHYEIADKLLNQPGFHEYDPGISEEGCKTTFIKFSGRYPKDSLYKTRNMVSDMDIKVLRGEGALYILDGKEKPHVFNEGDHVFVPKMMYYIWKVTRVVFLNRCTPPWEKKHQDMCKMTDQDQQFLQFLQAKDR